MLEDSLAPDRYWFSSLGRHEERLCCCWQKTYLCTRSLARPTTLSVQVSSYVPQQPSCEINVKKRGQYAWHIEYSTCVVEKHCPCDRPCKADGKKEADVTWKRNAFSSRGHGSESRKLWMPVSSHVP